MRHSAPIALAALLSMSTAHAGLAERRSPVVVATEKVKDAVVNISTEALVQYRGGGTGDEAFREFFQLGPVQQKYVPNSLGSGVVIDPKGYVVTNYHVVARGSRVKVGFADGKELVARVVGTDPQSDLAVLEVKSDKPLPFAPLASGELLIGETAIAIGNPYGLSHTVTAGVVSALHRSLKTETASFYEFVQTDASINPGNSGGPLLNIDGEIIGINTAIHGEAKGIGFAIPADRVKNISQTLIKYGEVPEAWIGLSVDNVQDEEHVRPIVTDVEPGSPAAKAGIENGDVLVSIEGSAPLQDADEFRFRMHGVPFGQAVKLEVAKPGGKGYLNVTPEPFPLDKAEGLVSRRIGLTLTEDKAKSPDGRTVKVLVVSDLRRNSPAFRAGLRPGDWVRAINSVEIGSLDDFRKAVRRAHQSGRLTLLIQRRIVLEQVEFSI